MKYVEIYQLKDDGKQHVVLTCTLDAGKIKISGDKGLSQRLWEQGILDYSASKLTRIYPDAGGLKFLEQLAHNFRSGYLMASDVKERV